MKLVLENHEGKAIRTFDVQSDQGVVISRKDTRRVEVHADVEPLVRKHVKFDRLGDVNRKSLELSPFAVGPGGRLKLVEESVGDVIHDFMQESENPNVWRGVFVGTLIVMAGFFAILATHTTETAKMEQELKQTVVQIVKHIPIKPQPVVQKQAANVEKEIVAQTVPTTRKTAAIKRLGALAAFGSLKSGPQKGGINLGAVNTTAGPGLGGTGGSGGIQTSLYGKGLVAAPLGAGANMQGGGGYGTKGKGGGQAGYGKISMVGSAGSDPIPLGKEALIEGGLDRDLIDEVIKKNMGQIRFCYEQGLQGEPSLAGRVAVDFTIASSGLVKSASIANSSLNSSQVQECIVMRLKSWKFPLPQGGVDVKVTYPFVLRRTGQA